MSLGSRYVQVEPPEIVLYQFMDGVWNTSLQERRPNGEALGEAKVFVGTVQIFLNLLVPSVTQVLQLMEGIISYTIAAIDGGPKPLNP